MIQIDKANNETNNIFNSKKLDEMSDAMRDICCLLNEKNKDFDCKEAFLKILNYVQTYDRLLYGDISSYCFSLKQEDMDNFSGNLVKMILFTDSDDFSTIVDEIKAKSSPENVELCDKAKRIIIKIYDHVNLASTQLNDLKKDDRDLEKKIDNQLQPVRADIIKEMSGQLLSLVAIFTAVAFVVFGGFSSLSNIFSNINGNTEKLILVVSIWGLAICNTVYILMYSIGHLLNINKRDEEKISLIPANLIKWSNLVLCTIGAISAWLFFADINGIAKWFVIFSKKHDIIVSIIGVILIIGIAIAVGIKLFKPKKEKTKNVDENN